MIENGYSTIELKKIQKIGVDGYDSMTKTNSMLLSDDEIKQMLTSCLDNMDRAFLAMLYEGGFLVGELGKLKWHHVSFNEWNVSINVNAKTGKPRYIPLVMSRPYLARWQNDYPMPVEPDGYVFLTSRCNKLQYNNVLNHLRDAATRAGITKHISAAHLQAQQDHSPEAARL